MPFKPKRKARKATKKRSSKKKGKNAEAAAPAAAAPKKKAVVRVPVAVKPPPAIRISGLSGDNAFLMGLYTRHGSDVNGAPAYAKLGVNESSVMRVYMSALNRLGEGRWYIGSHDEMEDNLDSGWVRSEETKSQRPLKLKWQLGGDGCGFFAEDGYNATPFLARLSKKITIKPAEACDIDALIDVLAVGGGTKEEKEEEKKTTK